MVGASALDPPPGQDPILEHMDAQTDAFVDFVSYAQNFEDVMLWRALKHVGPGRYIDIGAQDPMVDSVSLAFYEQGWRGVHVEPNPEYARLLRAARPDETVIEAAISTAGGTIAFFEIMDTGLSTGVAAIAEEHRREGFASRRIEVPAMKLARLLDRFEGQDVHWLKIDVEGMEEDAIASWAPSTVRPWIVVVESTRPGSPESTGTPWESALLGLGYERVYRDGLNNFYLSRQHLDLKRHFEVPPNVFDYFKLSGRASSRLCHHVRQEAETERAGLLGRIASLEARLRETTRLAEEAEARQAEAGRQLEQSRAWLDEARCALQAMHASRSWRVTRPLRAMTTRGRWLRDAARDGARAWARLAPGSRPHRAVLRVILALSHWLLEHPRLHALAMRLLDRVPAARALLHHFTRSGGAAGTMMWRPPGPADLSPRARQIHFWMNS